MNQNMIIAMVVLAATTYFFSIRPESTKKKKQSEMRETLSLGDTVTTIGGILGKIVHIDKNRITIETGEDRVRIQLVRHAISSAGEAQEEQT